MADTNLFGGVESILGFISKPEGHAAGVLIERLQKELAAIDLRRSEIRSTLETLERIRSDYQSSITQPQEAADA